MNTKQKKLNAYLLLFVLLGVITITMRTFATFLHLGDFGYYEGDLCTSANIALVLGGLIFFSYALVHRNDEAKQASFGSTLTYAPAVPLAVCLILLGVTFFRKETATKLAEFLLPLLGILAIASAFYFLFAVLYEIKVCDLRAIFGMVCSLFLIFYAGYLYFDTNLPINAATKLTDQAAFIFAAIFFLYETRISLGLERWHVYTSLGFFSSLVCAYASIPALLVYFFKDRIISNSIEETFVVFFLFVYIFCRTLLSLYLKPEKPTPFMAALHEDAKKLADAVAANGPLPFEPQVKEMPEEKTDAESAESAPTDAEDAQSGAEDAAIETHADTQEATEAPDAENASTQEDI